MVDVTLRGTKGSPLTHDEVDANFTNLKTAVEANAASIASNTSDISSNTTAIADAGGVTVYATIDDLPMSDNSNGDLALVSSTNRLYIFTNSGWYNIALINQTPTISGNDASYVLASDGTPTVVTLSATDPEGIPITWSHVATGLTNEATVTNVDNVFTITPSTDGANGGEFSITFRASDGVNIGTATSEFTLVFFASYWKDAVLSIGTGSTQTFNYRYVKWNIRNNGGDTYTSAIEFELYDENDTKINISSASGPYYNTQTPDNLIDGVTTTGSFDKWSVDSSTAQIVFDLGSQRTIKTYRWATSNNVPERDPTSWTIEGSNDNSTWAVLHTVSDYSSTASRNTFNPTHGFGTAVNNSTFIDRSTNAHTVTPTGTPTQTTFHPYLDNWSVELNNATPDFLKIDGNGVDLLGSGDFTVEAWAYLTTDFVSTNTRGIMSQYPASSAGTNNWIIGFRENKVRLFYTGGSSVASTSNISFNKWHHVAWTRSGTTNYLFLDGVQEATFEYSGDYSLLTGAGDQFEIGTWGGGTTNSWGGSISNARIVKGTALYTSAFTPPTQKLTAVTGTVLLACQSNRFIDNSSSGHTITPTGNTRVSASNPFGQESEYAPEENKGSIEFENGNQVQPTGSIIDVGTGDFTIEFWSYGIPASDAIVDTRVGTGNTTGALIQARDTGYRYQSSSSLTSASGLDPSIKQWLHFAAVRNSGTVTIYHNGVGEQVTTGDTTDFTQTTVTVGANSALGYDVAEGYCSDLRITKSAVYTADFTPPTAPVGNTNASLYLPFDNAGIYDKTGNHTLTLVGNTSTSTTQTKFADTAIYFDGSGDYITAPQIPLGTEDFTIEGWHYLLSRLTSRPCLLGNYTSFTTGALGLFAGHNNATDTQYQVAWNGTFPKLNAGTIAYNEWVHFALVRSSGVVKFYINGTSVGSFTGTEAINGVGDSFGIGITFDSTTDSQIHGYIENFQILKGVAKYTTNFTPPTRTQDRTYQAES